MTKDTRRECTPQEYIRRLFAETEDGKLSITYSPFLDNPYTLTYEMDWTAEDAERMVQHYDHLVAVVERLGKLHDALDDSASREKLLTQEEQEIWNTYICPFEPFEVELDEIAELYLRRETDSLSDDENELLERHHEWFRRNSLQRLPFKKCSPAFVINCVQRYEALVRMHAPEAVLQEEGRNLAEELILYCYGPLRTFEGEG